MGSLKDEQDRERRGQLSASIGVQAGISLSIIYLK